MQKEHFCDQVWWWCVWRLVSAAAQTPHTIVLHAARLLDVDTGRILTPGEVLVRGERIVEAGASVTHPGNAERGLTWATPH